jgi:hypothetical protein
MVVYKVMGISMRMELEQCGVVSGRDFIGILYH